MTLTPESFGLGFAPAPGLMDDSSNHSEQCSLPAYLRAPEVTAQVMAEYIWLSGANGQLRSKTKVLERKPATAEEAPVVVVDSAISREAAEENHELFLKPRKIFRDPFRGGDHILVLCDAFLVSPQVSSDASAAPATVLQPCEANSRVACENILKVAQPSQPVFAAEQEYAIIHPAYPTVVPLGPRRAISRSTSRNSSSGSRASKSPRTDSFVKRSAPVSDLEDEDLSFGRGGAALASGPNPNPKAARQLADAHLRCCLFAGVKVTGADVHSLSGLHSYKIGPSPGVDLGDDVWTSRYLLKRVAEDQGMCVSWAPDALPQERPLGCYFKYSTAETRQAPNGLGAIEQQLARLQASHVHHQVAYNEGRLERLASFEARTFTHAVGSGTASIVVPSLTYLQQGGYFTDRRPPADADPYKVALLLAATTLGMPLPQLPTTSSMGAPVAVSGGPVAPAAVCGAEFSPMGSYLLAMQHNPKYSTYESDSDDCNYDSCSESGSMDTDDVLLDELVKMDDEGQGGGANDDSDSSCESEEQASDGTSPSHVWMAPQAIECGMGAGI